MIDFKQLELFCSVVDYGGLAKASQVMFCSQPVLSTNIRKLERELGYELFDRTKRPMELTPVGKIAYRYATRLLKTRTSLYDEISRCTQRVIRIGASSVPSTYLLPSALVQFRKTHPDCSYTIRHGDSTEIVELVAEQVLDFGVVGTIVPNQECEFIRLCEERLVLALPPDYLKRQNEQKSVACILKRIPIIVREDGSGTFKHGMAALKHLGVETESLRIAAQLESQEAICQSIIAGMGASILSELVVKDHVEAGNMDVVDLGQFAVRSFYIVKHGKSDASSAYVNELLAHLIQNLSHQKNLESR